MKHHSLKRTLALLLAFCLAACERGPDQSQALADTGYGSTLRATPVDEHGVVCYYRTSQAGLSCVKVRP